MTDLATLRRDIATDLLMLDATALEVVARAVRVMVEAVKRSERAAFGELLSRSSLGQALAAMEKRPLKPACETDPVDLGQEVEEGRRCARCLDAIVAGECGCPEVFGDAGVDAEIEQGVSA